MRAIARRIADGRRDQRVHRLPARSHRLPGRARPEQRPSLVPAAQGRVRAAAQGADGGARRRPRRALRARGLPLRADPKRSIFRIYRDTRFAKDKSPYKTHISARASRGSAAARTTTRRRRRPRQRRLLQPAARRELRRRRDVDAARSPARRVPAADRRRAGSRPRRARGSGLPRRVRAGRTATSTLKRVPPGYPPDHPMADLFRYKDIVFGRRSVGRRGLLARAAGHPGRRVRGGDAGLPVPRRRSTR